MMNIYENNIVVTLIPSHTLPAMHKNRWKSPEDCQQNNQPGTPPLFQHSLEITNTKENKSILLICGYIFTLYIYCTASSA